jgi:O-antigen/teichoic acid export membrane protein
MAGLIVIRLLAPDQYAYYTLAMATLGLLTVLSDGGVSNALMAFGGPCWRDPKALGEVYHEAVRYRRGLSAAALALSLPALVYLLMSHKMNAIGAVLVAASIVPLFVFTVTGQLQESVLKLHQQLVVINTVQVSGAALRALALAAILAAIPQALVAVLVAGVVQAVVNMPLRRRVAPLVVPAAPATPELSANYRNYVRRSLPGAIYFAMSGQVNIAIISLLGSTEAVAQVGVAGRLGAACSVVSAVIGMTVVPRFARATIQPFRRVQIMYGLVVAIFVLGALASGLITWWPQSVPLLVGDKYTGLEGLVVWSIWCSIAGVAAGTVYHLAAVRGHVMRPSIAILAAVLSYVGSFLIIGASTPIKVFQMTLLSNAVLVLVGLAYATRCFVLIPRASHT